MNDYNLETDHYPLSPKKEGCDVGLKQIPSALRKNIGILGYRGSRDSRSAHEGLVIFGIWGLDFFLLAVIERQFLSNFHSTSDGTFTQ